MINTDSSHTSFCRFARAEVLGKFVAQPPEVRRGLTSTDLEGGVVERVLATSKRHFGLGDGPTGRRSRSR